MFPQFVLVVFPQLFDVVLPQLLLQEKLFPLLLWVQGALVQAHGFVLPELFLAELEVCHGFDIL